MPFNWQHKYPEFYKHIKNFMRKGKNIHDDGNIKLEVKLLRGVELTSEIISKALDELYKKKLEKGD